MLQTDGPGEVPWSPPRLLNDAPAVADTFGGGHARLARSLAGLIRDEDGGRSVALLGAFGSGKSTVVQLAESLLGHDGVAVLTFDVWAHSGDPLRRSFIEELVAFLDRRGWSPKKRWEDDLLRLSRRREETEVKSDPRLTVWGVLMGCALLLVPLGIALAVREGQTTLGTIAGFILVILPFLVVGAAWISAVHRRRLALQKGESPEEEDKALRSVLPLLIQDRQTETTSTTIRTPDPTTVEFRDVFRRVAQHALREPSRKLVVVVDNLDRLPAEEARAAWAVMRTFFDGVVRAGWQRRFWVVAPLDLSAPALRPTAAEDATDSTGTLDPPARTADDELITKTFAATLRVPPAVHSEWRDFLLSQLKAAFPYWDGQPGELRAVYGLFLRLRVSHDGSPTPRAVKAFVNRLVALDRQWRGDLPLRTLALYLLIGDQLSLDGSELRGSNFLTPDAAALVGDSWQRDLAAVHFNVEPEKALQVLSGDQVQTALETGDHEPLRALAGTAGLGEVVLTVVQGYAAAETLAGLARAAHALREAALPDSDGLRESWAAIARACERRREGLIAGPVDVGDPKVSSGLVALVRNAPDDLMEEVAVTVVRALSSAGRVAPSEKPDQVTWDPAQWADTVARVLTAGAIGRAPSRLAVPVSSAADYLRVLRVVAEMTDPALRTAIAKHARPPDAAPAKSVADAVVSSVEEETFGQVAPALGVMPLVESQAGTPVQWTWDEIVIALRDAVNPELSSPSPMEAAALMGALMTLYVSGSQAAEPAQKALDAFVPSGVLHRLSLDKQVPEAAGADLLSLLLFPSRAVRPPSASEQQSPTATAHADGHAFFEAVRSSPGKHTAVVNAAADSAPAEALRRLFRNPPGKLKGALFAALVRRADGRNDASQVFDLDVLLANAAALQEAMGDSYHVRLREHLESPEALVPTELRHLRPEAYGAVVGALTDPGSYRVAVRHTYQAFTTEKWAEIITEWPDALRLAVHLAKSEATQLDPGADLADALRAHVAAVASGDRPADAGPTGVHDLIHLLPEGARAGFLVRLRAVVLERGLQGLRAIVGAPYALDFAATGGWANEADRVVSDLLAPIVTEGRGDEARWAVHLVKSEPEVLSRAEPGLRIELLDRINSRCSKKKTTGVVRTALADLAESVRPHIAKPKRPKGLLARATAEMEKLFVSSTPVRRAKPSEGRSDERD